MTGHLSPRDLFIRLFEAAVAAADPLEALKPLLPAKPKGRTVVIGAGKGSARMASAFETLWDAPLSGVVVTRYGYGVPCRSIKVMEAAHPVPDAAGLAASEALFAALKDLTADDLVVALISGGGSALLPCPAPGLTFADEVAVNKALLKSGAPIAAMNCLRKHVSAVKGGRLALAARPARLVTLLVSDVPGDDPAEVASGPTVASAARRHDALDVVRHFGLDVPVSVLRHLQDPAQETPSPEDAAFAGQEVHVIASAAKSLEAAALLGRSLGYATHILSDAIEGEASEVAKMHAAIAREVKLRNRPFAQPALILSGGETTVTVRAKGKGGRNSAFLLSLALAIDGMKDIHAFAADTDGVDGTEDNAGAFADGATAGLIRSAGLDPKALLNGNDTWTAFNAIGALFTPGPTGTNVNDFRAMLIR